MTTVRIGRALVVGASSGIGAAVARRLALEGARVALVARRAPDLDTVARSIEECAGPGRTVCFPHDVTRSAEAEPLLGRIAAELGGLDLVVYAAGVMPAVGPDTYDLSLDRQMMDVNVIGAMAWLGAAASLFTQQRSGILCGISSVAGERGRRGNPAYGASKAALTSYLESLRNRLARHGVAVVTIKPGYVDTAMTRGLPGLFWVISADRAAQAIVRAVKRRGGTRYVPRRWGLVAFVVRSIPSFLMKKLDF